MAGMLVEQAFCSASIAGLQVRKKKYSSLSMPAPLIFGVVWRRLARCVEAFTRASSSPGHSPVEP